uniref:ANK_REP_REGION domain-containing protein n=1 Tax=Ascaris lumbricoides TaxID=6252 RepID=A0A0M3I7X7_ASCLU
MESDSSTRTHNGSDSQRPSTLSHARIPRNPNAVHTYIPHATMECERWLRARLDDLRMKTILDQKTDLHLPQKLEKSFTEFNSDERNIRGETLIISVIRYEPDKANQIRNINMLVRSGCDLSQPDSKHLRTPLMVACLMRNDAIAHHLITHNANLTAADKMGNTALMYAAMYSQSSLVSYLAEELSKRWALDAFRAKNRMGYTAETLARKNERYMFSMYEMLKKQRLKIVKRLRDYVTSNLKYSPEFASWKRFVCLYRVSA